MCVTSVLWRTKLIGSPSLSDVELDVDGENLRAVR